MVMKAIVQLITKIKKAVLKWPDKKNVTVSNLEWLEVKELYMRKMGVDEVFALEAFESELGEGYTFDASLFAEPWLKKGSVWLSEEVLDEYTIQTQKEQCYGYEGYVEWARLAVEYVEEEIA